jgi:predicted dehydrogenase
VHGHFPAWRAYREYAGGGLADMGAHHFDIAQWALDMDMSGPVKVIPPKDPKAITGLRFVYANGLEMFHGGEADCVFVGEKGTIRVSRGKIEADPMSILEMKLPDGGFRAYPSNNHRRNWLESVRQKKECICTAETGHRSASVCHLGNIGYRLGRELTWDPARETFAGDAEAQALVNPPMRAGYSW